MKVADFGLARQIVIPAKKLTGKHLLRKKFTVEDSTKIESLLLDYVTAGEMRVYLNGTLIMHLNPEGGKSKYDRASIPLKPVTVELLKSGSNCLAVEINHPKGVDPFNLTLKAALK